MIKLPWMIQVHVADKDVKAMTVTELRRRLKGSGVEVDASYEPLRVAPGRFVGRGFATERAKNKLSSWKRDAVLFKELRMSAT
jgi:hypothetical protein